MLKGWLLGFLSLVLGVFFISGCAVLSPDDNGNGGNSGGGWGNHDGSSGPVSLAISPGNTSSSLWLAQIMDQYHKTYDVYSDMNAAGNHFVAKALMGENLIVMNENEKTVVHTGDSSIKVTFNPANSTMGSFLSSTKPDGTGNTTVIVVNSECLPFLSLNLTEARYTNALSFAERNHQVGTYGFDFNTDKDGSWYEGMAGMAMAYLYKNLSTKASSVITALNAGQATSGAMYATSKDELTTGYEWQPGSTLYYYKREHAGTTAWKLLVDKRKNPYWYGSGSDTLPGTPVAGATAGYTYLTNMQDIYHRTFDVYTDHDSGGNHFVCYAGIGTIPGFNTEYQSDKYSGDTAIRAVSGSAWGGFYFLNGVLSNTMTEPGQNWGTVPNAGVDLSGATTLTFWAKGAAGNEQVEFFCGGVGYLENGSPDTTKPYRDSLTKTSNVVTLTTAWTKYTISLAGKNLTNVLGGFGFVIKQAGKTIYIDQIQYNKPRLTEPRFIVSFKTTLASGKMVDRVMRQTAYTYDNSMALISLLASGDTTRAKYIADALVYARTNDRYFTDGRLRNAYAAGDYRLGAGWTPNGKANAMRLPCWFINVDPEDKYAVGTSANTMGWAMIALISYYQATGSTGTIYLDTAKALGDWVEAQLRAPDGGYYAGFTGWEPSPTKDTSKVVEHNSTLYSAFSRLYTITADSKWNTRALYAKNYVLSMWSASSGFYFMQGLYDSVTKTAITNWGNTPNAGADLTGATKLTFWAKGASGNEKVEFFCGGIGRNPDTGAAIAPYPDSLTKTSLGVVTLTPNWTQYTISLSGKVLTNVLGGFGYYATSAGTAPVTFYLDDIQYDKSRLTEPRLLVSYKTINSTNAIDMVEKNAAFVYDNALAIMAFLVAGENDRAKMVGDALIYAQDHDRYFTDGRLRNAYQGGDIIAPNGWVINGKTAVARTTGWWNNGQYYEDSYAQSQDTGNQAWAMLAWLALYNKVNDVKYLNAAKKMGDWVDLNLKDTVSHASNNGGYMGKFYATSNNWEPGELQRYKSTEHNLDLYAAFTRLYQITGEAKWQTRAVSASNFCMAMWNPGWKMFWTGTRSDSVSISYGIPEDVIPIDANPWMLLAFRLQGTQYTNGLTFVEQNAKYATSWVFDYDCYDPLTPDKRPYPGAPRNSWREGAWYEGTAMMAVAYMLTGMEVKATNVQNAILADRASDGGVYAAGPSGNDYIWTGFWLAEGPWYYYRREAVACTAWTVMVEKRANPFWLGTAYEWIPVSTPAVTNTFGIFTETAAHRSEGYVPWGTTASLLSWSGTVSITEEAPGTGGEGGTCWKYTINSAGWFGAGVSSTITTNLLRYDGGSLVLKAKTSGTSTIRVGLESDGGQQAWVRLASYGFVQNGTWQTITIPISALRASNASFDLTKVKQYFIVSQDGTPVVGNTFNIDDVYLMKVQ